MKRVIFTLLILFSSSSYGVAIFLNCENYIFQISTPPESSSNKVFKDGVDFDGIDKEHKWILKLDKLKITDSLIEFEQSMKLPPREKGNHSTITYYSVNRFTGIMNIRMVTTFKDGKDLINTYGPINCSSVKQKF